MTGNARRRKRADRGMAYVLALLFLCIFSALAVALANGTSMNLASASNLTSAGEARLAAESGLAFLTWRLQQCNCQGSGQALFDSVAAKLQAALNGSANLAGASVAYDGTTITIPPIIVDDRGRQFGAALTLAPTGDIHARINGIRGYVARSIGIDLRPTQRRSAVFDFGIATRSAVEMTGNARVRGQNDPAEAQILSATYSVPEAFRITGNANLEGDIHASNPNAQVTLTGNVSIGGKSLNDPEINDHIHLGVGDVDFPEVDPTVFEPFATTVLSGPTSGNRTFTNIRIPANTNPTFSGNITLKGVIFIETPNKVHFSGNVNLTGVIVSQDAGENVYAANTIKFTGNMTAQGVEQLPDTAEFHVLRQMPGSFILAPGFGVQFSGNFGTVGGCMAADSFTFTGNAGGVVRGGIINYSDSTFRLTGNSQITIDRDGTPTTPPGFSATTVVTAVPGSYVEYLD